MELNREVEKNSLIRKIKCLSAVLHEKDKDTSTSTDALLFLIHQEIDQYLFGGDGNLTYVGKIMELKEKGKI